MSSTGNGIHGNVLTGGVISATSTITGSTLLAGGISLTGNSITSTNSTITIDPNSAGGVDGAVIIAGNLSVQGNVTYIDSNVITTNEKSITLANNQSTGAALDGAGIDIGNANQYYWRYNNATTSWQANIGITPAANASLNLGGTSNYWGIVYANAVVSATTVSAIGNVTGGNVLTAGIMSSTGNGIHGNILTAGLISATGAITTAGDISIIGNIVDTGAMFINTSANGNITINPNGTGVIVVNKDIVNGQANGVGNIGSATTYFNTVFAKATSAQYADLAEKYQADAEYTPGTVVSFGGDREVTVSTTDGDRRVAGVVSTNPSYIMNGGLDGANIVTVALTGRVPTRVTGTVRKGDLMVSNGDGTARAEADPRAGAIIGKALEDFDGDTGTIEVVVGRF
jgi:hypothetical protein